MNAVIVILLFAVAACAGVGAAVVFAVAVYASWRFYFVFIPAKVSVEWSREYSDAEAQQHRAALYLAEDDGHYPEFNDHDRDKAHVQLFPVHDGRIEVRAYRPPRRSHGVRHATDVPVPCGALQHTVPTEDMIETMAADEKTVQ